MMAIRRCDLARGHQIGIAPGGGHHHDVGLPAIAAEIADIGDAEHVAVALIEVLEACIGDPHRPGRIEVAAVAAPDREVALGTRLEEHTSELQSLMRHSYACCCLEKKTKIMSEK